jgi:hypothetical protein
MTEAEFRKLRVRIWTERFLHKKLWFSRSRAKLIAKSMMKAIGVVWQ